MPTPSPPFAFLDLPPELRLMVYEYLPYETHVYLPRVDKEPHYIIEIPRPNTAVLQACHVIHNEAKRIVRENAAAAAAIPPQIIIKKCSRETCREIDTLSYRIYDYHYHPSEKDYSTIIYGRHITISHNSAFRKMITKLARSWPKLEVILPVTGVASDICGTGSLLWYFLLSMEEIRLAMGLEVVVRIRRSELNECEEGLLRKTLGDSGMEIPIKMLED
jgi:hypothetical protein